MCATGNIKQLQQILVYRLILYLTSLFKILMHTNPKVYRQVVIISNTNKLFLLPGCSRNAW